MVLIDYVGLLVTEDKRSKAREEDRVAIELLYTQAGRRISSVRAGNSSVEDTSKSFPMGGNPCQDCWKISCN